MFGSVEIRSRPLRLGFLVDHDSKDHALGSIQLATSLWGGNYFPIIPMFKRVPMSWQKKGLGRTSANSIISGYVDAFDPDVLVQFSKAIPDCVKNRGIEIIEPTVIWRHFKPGSYPYPLFGIGLFEIMSDIFEKYFRYTPKYPVQVIIPTLPKQYRLFWASLLGDIPSQLLPEVDRLYSKHLDIRYATITPDSFHELGADNVLFPRAMTKHALQPSTRFFSRPSPTVFFMDATRVEDIVDFWNLRALGRVVLPLPKQFAGTSLFRDMTCRLVESGKKKVRPNQVGRNQVTFIRSGSVSMQEMEDFVRTLAIPSDPNVSPFEQPYSLQHWYPRIWDEWARPRDTATPVEHIAEERTLDLSENEGLPLRFQPLIPALAHKFRHLSEPFCSNEISFRFYGAKKFLAEALPTVPGKNVLKAISSITAKRGEWRVGKGGLVNLVEREHSIAWAIPESQEVLFSYLRDFGWIPQLSPPGTLAKQVYSMLDGNIHALAEEKLLGLLEHMNGGSTNRDGTPTDSNQIRQERELSVADVKQRLASMRSKGDLYKYLIAKGFFKLGLRVKCPHCGRNAFYPIDIVRESLSCLKCLSVFPSVGSIEAGTWCYRTAGPFSIPGYADGAYAVLLALDFFGDMKMSGLRISPSFSFTAQSAGGHKVEVDFAALWEEKTYWEPMSGVIFGECKTYGEFRKKDFDKMALLARSFPGAVLAFCTLRKTLKPSEIRGLVALAKKGRKYWKGDRPQNPVLILTGTELLSSYGPPSCWKSLGCKERFSRTNGLIAVCDATQQIHLGLPSWHDQWAEQRLSRSNRRQTGKSPVSS